MAERVCLSYPSAHMSNRLATADAANAPARAMTACALMTMTSKIMTDPSGPELCRAT
ncbi:hypothetical protein MCEMIH16_00892 [Caulobacteraceae bacterium]